MPPRRSITLLLTGAPCSGKSTLAGLIEQHLAETDAKVVVVRETATARILGSDATVTPIEFQRRVLDDQVRAEGEAHETAAALNTAGHDVLCVLDRGRRDGKLFCDPSAWEAIDGDRISDGGQYDIVAHLTSMAIDAPAVYDTAQRQGQNPARTHTREQSALLCPRFATLYPGVPCVRITGSADPITDKLDRMLEALDEHTPPTMVQLKQGIQRARNRIATERAAPVPTTPAPSGEGGAAHRPQARGHGSHCRESKRMRRVAAAIHKTEGHPNTVRETGHCE
jgi:energy-coupling factor transporter ATP-binding protein EcfA2